ncbi:MAG: hypothetical protein ACXU9C_10500 [Xanthobacteraceae bacterium]
MAARHTSGAPVLALERDPAAVRADVEEELISARSARDYGVVLRDDLNIDQAATERARHAIRSQAGNAKEATK